MGLRKSEPVAFLRSDSRCDRLQAVLEKVSERHQRALIGPVDRCPVGFPGATVTLPNGEKVVVGVDLDYPDELFEVVREPHPVEPLQGFERHLKDGMTGLTQLSAEDVLQVMARYALAPSKH